MDLIAEEYGIDGKLFLVKTVFNTWPLWYSRSFVPDFLGKAMAAIVQKVE